MYKYIENFGPELLPNTVVLQAIHLIATDNLLFAQSDLSDTIEIKRSSLKLAWSLCKLRKLELIVMSLC